MKQVVSTVDSPLLKTEAQLLALAVGRGRTRAGAWTRAGTGHGGSLGRRRGGRGGGLAGLGGAFGRLLWFVAWGWGAAGGGTAARAGAVVSLYRAAGASRGAWGRATARTRAGARRAFRPGTTSWPLLGCLDELDFPAIDFLSRQFLKGVFQIAVRGKLNHPFVELGSMCVCECHLSSLSHEIFQVLHT